MNKTDRHDITEILLKVALDTTKQINNKNKTQKLLFISAKFFFCQNSNIFVLERFLDMSLISRSCKNDHIIFNVGTPSLEARNIRLVNIITYIIEESKLCHFLNLKMIH
jgi:hypothetical protein